MLMLMKASTHYELGGSIDRRMIMSLCYRCFFQENLAYDKLTSQSSTYSDHGGAGISDRAVDGNINTDYYADRTCTHTNDGRYAWWRVDLGQVEAVSEVYIVNRGGYWGWRLGSFEIRVGRSKFRYSKYLVVAEATTSYSVAAGSAQRATCFSGCALFQNYGVTGTKNG